GNPPESPFVQLPSCRMSLRAAVSASLLAAIADHPLRRTRPAAHRHRRAPLQPRRWRPVGGVLRTIAASRRLARTLAALRGRPSGPPKGRSAALRSHAPDAAPSSAPVHKTPPAGYCAFP